MRAVRSLPDLGTNAAYGSRLGRGKVTPRGWGVTAPPGLPGRGARHSVVAAAGTQRSAPGGSAGSPGNLHLGAAPAAVAQSRAAAPGHGALPLRAGGSGRDVPGRPGAAAPRGLPPCPPREEGVGAPPQKPRAPRVGRRCMGRRSQADPGENVLHGICKSGYREGPK